VGVKLIAGLGNPGRKYENSRHNIGFRVTDKLAYKYKAKLKHNIFSKSRQTNISMLSEDVVIIQPLTYMNLSGGCVAHFYKKLNLNPQDLLVIYDDISLSLGKIRLRPGGSSGGHNGVESIIAALKNEEFSRLRVGIQTESLPENLSEYVLSGFNKEEEDIIEGVIDTAVSACESWLRDGTETAMNKFN